MAQPAPGEQAAVPPTAKGTPNGGFRPGAASRASSPGSRMSPAAPPGSFQAINTSRAPSENARLASPAAASQHHSGTPPSSVVAHGSASQTPQTHPSKLSSQVDANLDTVMADSTYGTRSRNRTNTRPNYAEDQDMDFEFSSAATTTTTKKKAADAPASAAQDASQPKRAPEQASFTAVNSNGTPTAKEPSGNTGAGTGTKKRKAAGAPAAALQQTSGATSTPPPTRKPTASTSSTLARETNVMTFSKHRNCLNKKGELIADDGTKLSVNGKLCTLCNFRRCSSWEMGGCTAAMRGHLVDSFTLTFHDRSRVPSM